MPERKLMTTAEIAAFFRQLGCRETQVLQVLPADDKHPVCYITLAELEQ